MTALHASDSDPATPVRSATARRAALAGLALLVAVFAALGTWQLERRAWKLELIARVEQRVHGEPIAPPDAGLASGRLAAEWEYRRVRLAGRYLAGADTFVQAVTDLGPGLWVLTPFQRQGGGTVVVNRGFVGSKDVAPPATEPTTVTGLLRLTEPGGGFLRDNDPARDRWFSRDVVAISAARGLRDVAPYFIDADAGGAGAAPGVPRGGLTVVRFANNHLVYAVTWYVLAALSAAAAVPLVRDARRRHDRPRPEAVA